MAVAVAAMTVVIVQRIALSCARLGNTVSNADTSRLIDRALRGDSAAIAALARCRPRECLPLARRLLLPLIEDRDPQRIAATRRDHAGHADDSIAESIPAQPVVVAAGDRVASARRDAVTRHDPA
jgi:hypothetical protein